MAPSDGGVATGDAPAGPAIATPGVILLYDLRQRGASHAPFTRAFTQMLAQACPGRPIMLHAPASHLHAAFAEPCPELAGRLSCTAIAEPLRAPSLLGTLRLLHRSDRRWRAQRPLVIFLTAQPAEIWAAKLFCRLAGGFRCHLVLHGDVGRFRRHRSRQPWRRLADYAGSLTQANHRAVRFLALEPHIAATLATLLPAAAGVLDAIHHPCLPAAALDWQSAPPPAGRLRFGLPGMAGPSKGLDVFARLAREAACEGAEFRLVGRLQPGWQALDLRGISGPRPFTEAWLPRPQFEQELAALHYLVLPYEPGYYALSASGVLLDALRWRKPVIAFATPALAALTERFGEIGHLCADAEAMLATVRALTRGLVAARYAAQRRNLDAAYRSRLPAAVAREYAALLRTRWGFAVADSDPAPAAA